MLWLDLEFAKKLVRKLSRYEKPDDDILAARKSQWLSADGDVKVCVQKAYDPLLVSTQPS
jgi:hypothetical protein